METVEGSMRDMMGLLVFLLLSERRQRRVRT